MTFDREKRLVKNIEEEKKIFLLFMLKNRWQIFALGDVSPFFYISKIKKGKR